VTSISGTSPWLTGAVPHERVRRRTSHSYVRRENVGPINVPVCRVFARQRCEAGYTSAIRTALDPGGCGLRCHRDDPYVAKVVIKACEPLISVARQGLGEGAVESHRKLQGRLPMGVRCLRFPCSYCGHLPGGQTIAQFGKLAREFLVSVAESCWIMLLDIIGELGRDCTRLESLPKRFQHVHGRKEEHLVLPDRPPTVPSPHCGGTPELRLNTELRAVSSYWCDTSRPCRDIVGAGFRNCVDHRRRVAPVFGEKY